MYARLRVYAGWKHITRFSVSLLPLMPCCLEPLYGPWGMGSRNIYIVIYSRAHESVSGSTFRVNVYAWQLKQTRHRATVSTLEFSRVFMWFKDLKAKYSSASVVKEMGTRATRTSLLLVMCFGTTRVYVHTHMKRIYSIHSVHLQTPPHHNVSLRYVFLPIYRARSEPFSKSCTVRANGSLNWISTCLQAAVFLSKRSHRTHEPDGETTTIGTRRGSMLCAVRVRVACVKLSARVLVWKERHRTRARFRRGRNGKVERQHTHAPCENGSALI